MRKLDMTKLATLTTANEILDSKYGKEGTKSREEFNQASKEWYEQQTETGSYRVSMPKALHDSFSQFAKSKGMSISAYINELVSRELQVAQ